MRQWVGSVQAFRWQVLAGSSTVAALTLGSYTSVRAEEADASQVVTLPEVVVTATRSEEELAQVPYTADTLTAQDIQYRKLSRTTPEALREVSAVMVQKTAHGQGSPFIRGFTGFRNLFLIDGVRLNNSVFRDGPNQYWNTVDPFTIDRLEIVKGPSSVLYGSDAVGGTVNALTPSPFDVPSDRAWGGRTYYRYSTAEDAHVFRNEGRAVLDRKAGLRAGFSYKDFGELETGGGTRPKTDYEEFGVDARLDYFVTPELRVSLAHQTVDQDDVWRTHKTIFGRSFRGTTIGSEKVRVLDQNRHLTYARLEATELPVLARTLELTVSHHRQEEERFRVRADDRSDRQGFDVDTLGIALQAASDGPVGQWVYGAEYYRDFVDSFRRNVSADGSLSSVAIQGPVADDATYDTLGLYIQKTVTFAERFDVLVGGRYNYIEADADQFEDPATGEPDALTKDFDEAVGSFRALYRLFPEAGVNLFAGVSQGFRAPNLSDLTRLDTARTDEIETPSPDVEPEHFLAYEAGIKAGGANAFIEVAYYYTDIEDMIVRTPTGRIVAGNNEVTKQNAGDGFVHGVEVNGSVRLLEDWTLWGNLTWMEGEVDTFPTSAPVKKREPIDRLMPLTANAGIRFQPSTKYWIEGVITAADNQDKLSTRDQADTQRIPPGGTPGYAVFSVRGGWQLTPEITLAAALDNIGDKDYRIHGSGLNEPGRNFIVAAEYAF